MREAGWITTALATLGAALLLVGMPTEAHRDRGPNDACRREIGASLLHITLYQTQFDPVAEVVGTYQQPLKFVDLRLHRCSSEYLAVATRVNAVGIDQRLSRKW